MNKYWIECKCGAKNSILLDKCPECLAKREFDYTDMFNMIRKRCGQSDAECPVEKECIALWDAMGKIQDPPAIED